MKSVSYEINGITRKMIWNAHCRTVHLLARDGKDGASFLDAHAFDSKPFSDYGPSNLLPVADTVNVSWHRASSNPAMVQYSTKEYELGYQASALEDIDDFNNTVFRNLNSGGALPVGRAVRLSTSKKRKSQNMPGAAVREERSTIPRSNWLPFAHLDSASNSHVSQPRTITPVNIIHQADLHSVYQKPVTSVSTAYAHRGILYSPPTHLEKLFGHHDTEAPNSDHSGTPVQSIEYAEKVHPWRMRLINHHKRRLTRKWGNTPQALDCAVQSLQQAIATAISMGIRPTAHDYQKKVKTITAREQQREHVRPFHQSQKECGSASTKGTTPESRMSHDCLTDPIMALSDSISGYLALTELLRLAPSARPKKKRKRDTTAVEQTPANAYAKQKTTASKSCRHPVTQSGGTGLSAHQLPPPCPNGSRTLELHQHLPPNAYFEPSSEDEKPVWRCAFKHAMGHYYNAGDRKSCRGCNTSLSDNVRVTLMDFYLPPRTFHFQPAPDMRWKPSKQSAQLRKSHRPCHNAVAKDAYWEATNTGASEEEARQMGVNAVVKYIKPKPSPKAPTPEPTPEPELDLGPHPNGSATMEHGQEIPDGSYWEKRKAGEKRAWRCDVNHGLGRYYLAGDKKSCPGCGSSQNGPGKHEEMDFYLPSSVIVRQEAPGLSKYKPRKPYNLSKSTATKRVMVTHNQMCSKVYFELVAEGYEAEEAMRLAVERLDNELDQKQEKKLKRQDEREKGEDSDAFRKMSTASSASRKNSANTSQADNSKRTQYRRNSRGGCTTTLTPKKRTTNDLSEDETDEIFIGQEIQDTTTEQDHWDYTELSSDEEGSSASEVE
jgi:hypothetical protein